MPIFEDGVRPGTAVSVRASVAIELEWLLHSAVRPDFLDEQPVVDALYRADPALRADVASLWDEPGDWAAFSEIVLLAHHGGLLLSDDADLLLKRLPELCATAPTTARDLPLVAETDLDRRVLHGRLARLRRSAAVRTRYVEVLRRVWGAASAAWEAHGREAVAEAVSSRQLLLAKGADWRELTKGACQFGDSADRLVAAMGGSGEVVVVPSYFGTCGLLYDLPGYVVLGIRAEGTGAEARARTEALARQLRALSDPTRLAIVDTLALGPKTVTELSSRFGLAQPTVSNHVKLLREAGVVGDVRDGTRRNLVLRAEVLRALVDDLGRLAERADARRTADASAGGDGGAPRGQ